MRWLTVPERHPGFTVLAVSVLFGLAYGTSLVVLPKASGRIVIGDALHHYVQLRSAVFDHDLHFQNEYIRLYRLKGGEPGTEWIYEPTATGHVRNLMPVGPAIVWAPGFLLVSGGVWLADRLGASYPLDGYGRLFQATAGFGGIAAAGLGAWLACLAAASLFDKRAAVWAMLTVWLASSSLYYSVISPTYSHAASMLAVSGFWLAWVRSRQYQTAPRYAMLGVLIGIAALMRWQDAVFLVIPAIDAAWHLRRELVVPTAGRLLACAGGAVVGFGPQMIVWVVLYGTPLAIPQGAGFMRWTEPALWAVLMSDNHGLFTWTPVIALSLAGLVSITRRVPLVGVAAVLVFAVSWYVNAAVADWWGGEAFGARRFLSCFPVFVLGLAAIFNRFGTRLGVIAAVAAVFTVHTLLLLLQYQALMHGLWDVVPSPRGVDGLWLARFRAPFDLIAWWLGRS